MILANFNMISTHTHANLMLWLIGLQRNKKNYNSTIKSNIAVVQNFNKQEVNIE